MVRISNLEEYKRIKESDFGFLIIPDNSKDMVIHSPSCNLLGADDYIEQREKSPESIELHWFSTIAMAEKKFDDIHACDKCKPE